MRSIVPRCQPWFYNVNGRQALGMFRTQVFVFGPLSNDRERFKTSESHRHSRDACGRVVLIDETFIVCVDSKRNTNIYYKTENNKPMTSLRCVGGP